MTAFKTNDGLFEWEVLPFGACNGPASMQSFIDGIFEDLRDFLVAYMDDILVHADTEGELTRRTKLVLQRLRKAGLYCKLSKCQFHVTEVKFLGFLISNGKIAMDPERVATITEWPM